MGTELSEQEGIRRESLNEIIKAGINPYPAELFEINVSAEEILEEFS